MRRTSRLHTVTLGDLHAALRALDREEAAMTEWLRRKVEEAFADPGPDIPAEDVFARLRERHTRRISG